MKKEEFEQKIVWAADNFAGYVTVENAKVITGYTQKGTINALRRMVKMGILIEHKVTANSTQILLFCISKHGRETNSGNDKEQKAFSIKHFRAGTLNHEMQIQRFAAKLSRGEASDLYFSRPITIGGRVNGNRKIGGRKPDAMINDEVAFELELTIKSIKRYQKIFGVYNRTKTKSYWFVPENIVHRFDKILDELLDSGNAHLYHVYAFDDNEQHTPSAGHRERKQWLEDLENERQAKAEEKERQLAERALAAKEETRRREVAQNEYEALEKALQGKEKASAYLVPMCYVIAGLAAVYSLKLSYPSNVLAYVIAVTSFCLVMLIKYDISKTKALVEKGIDY